jgi:ribosomal protein S18 acetylase RimI-like enzyme
VEVRQARPEEHDEIYRMGFDAWGDGRPLEAYLDGCRRSLKYRKGRWYVLADPRGRLRSSLIRYELADGICGIGSIATPPSFRGQGHASRLVALALEKFAAEGFPAAFLFSDIGASFYERFGFLALPKPHQRREGSLCMVRGMDIAALGPGFQPPDYF